MKPNPFEALENINRKIKLKEIELSELREEQLFWIDQTQEAKADCDDVAQAAVEAMGGPRR